MSDKVYFLEGGIGKNIAATAVISRLGREEPVSVVSSWAEVFANNPYVKELHAFHMDLYKALKGKNIVKLDAYTISDYREGKIPLYKAYFECAGLDYEGEWPQLFFTEEEVEWARKYTSEVQRPLFLFQPFGASTQIGATGGFQVRSLKKEHAQEIANFLSEHGTVWVLRNLQQPHLEGVKHPDLDLRRSLILCGVADGFVGIDSWLCHAAGALKKPGFFVFMSTPPEAVSYPLHHNYQERGKCPLHPCNRPWAGVPDRFACPFGRACEDINLNDLRDQLLKYIQEVLP